MPTEDVSTRELEAKVSERKEFLLKLIDFTGFIVENGKIISRYIHSSHTNVKWELNDFGGFNFQYQSGFSMMGGSGFRIWKGEEPLFLLHFNWWSESDPEVSFWSSMENWQGEIEQVIEKKHKISQSVKLETEEREQEAQEEREVSLRRDELLREAERLGL